MSAFKPDAPARLTRSTPSGSPPSGPTTSASASGRSSEALPVAVIVGAHGIRGWVRAHLHAPDSKSLRPGLRVTLRADGAADRVLKLLAFERIPNKPLARLHFEGVTDRDVAEALRGCQLWLARADLPALAADEFYLADLIGLPVERLRPDGRVQPLGTVLALTSNGAQDLLEVEYQPPGRRPDTWLLPVLPQFIVEIEGRLRVDLPIGMLPDALADGDEDDDDGDEDKGGPQESGE